MEEYDTLNQKAKAQLIHGSPASISSAEKKCSFGIRKLSKFYNGVVCDGVHGHKYDSPPNVNLLLCQFSGFFLGYL